MEFKNYFDKDEIYCFN